MRLSESNYVTVGRRYKTSKKNNIFWTQISKPTEFKVEGGWLLVFPQIIEQLKDHGRNQLNFIMSEWISLDRRHFCRTIQSTSWLIWSIKTASYINGNFPAQGSSILGVIHTWCDRSNLIERLFSFSIVCLWNVIGPSMCWYEKNWPSRGHLHRNCPRHGSFQHINITSYHFAARTGMWECGWRFGGAWHLGKPRALFSSVTHSRSTANHSSPSNF